VAAAGAVHVTKLTPTGSECQPYVRDFFAQELLKHGDGIFLPGGAGGAGGGVGADASGRATVEMDPACAMTPEERSAAAAGVMAALREAGVIGGWRDELFPVSAGYGQGMANSHSPYPYTPELRCLISCHH
jgi:hypothetical protein